MLFTSLGCILILAFFVWHYTTFNSLVNSRTAASQAWSNTEVELKRRLDLIQNLVEVVKGYSKHEAETLSKVIASRTSQAAKGQSARDATESTPFIKDTLSRIFVLAESYPQLKASENFLSLQKELVTTEDRIAERRHAYNQTISTYKIRQQAFPSSLVNWVHEFPALDFFDAPDGEINRIVEVRFP